MARAYFELPEVKRWVLYQTEQAQKIKLVVISSDKKKCTIWMDHLEKIMSEKTNLIFKNGFSSACFSYPEWISGFPRYHIDFSLNSLSVIAFSTEGIGFQEQKFAYEKSIDPGYLQSLSDQHRELLRSKDEIKNAYLAFRSGRNIRCNKLLTALEYRKKINVISVYEHKALESLKVICKIY